MSDLYILEINPLSVVSFAIIFVHSEGCLFVLLVVSFIVQKNLHQGHCRLRFPLCVRLWEALEIRFLASG